MYLYELNVQLYYIVEINYIVHINYINRTIGNLNYWKSIHFPNELQ